MIDVENLKRKRSKLVKEMFAITSKAQERDDKKMTDDEERSWSEKNEEVRALDEEIKRSIRMNELEMGNVPDDEDDDSPQKRNNDTPREKRFESFGEFLGAVMAAESRSQPTDERLIRAVTGQGETVGSDGGFLVQSDFTDEIMKKVFDLSIFISRARRQPIGPRSNRFTWNGLKENSRKDTYRHGGIAAYWTPEATSITASKAKFEPREIKLEKVAALMHATEEQLQDTIAMEGFLMNLASEAISFKVDDAFFRGTGAGMPQGVSNSDVFLAIAKESGQDAGSIVKENIEKMWARLWSRSMPRAEWFINQDCLPELMSMAQVVGTAGVPVYLPANGISGTPYSTLLGRPVIPTEFNETVGTKGDIMLADWKEYMYIDKGGMKANSSIHVKFVEDETTFKLTYRVNGQPLWPEPLTPYRGTNTQSPFVGLATRA